MPNTIRIHRVLRAAPEKVYRAFLNPEAMAKWLPPNGFTGKVHQMDAKVGGSYRMSFNNLSNGQSHSFGGHISNSCRMNVSATPTSSTTRIMPGEMQVAITLKKVSCGTELNILQEGVPDVIPPEMCYLGWQESLILLGKLVRSRDCLTGLGRKKRRRRRKLPTSEVGMRIA